jgi:hypothetical protein
MRSTAYLQDPSASVSGSLRTSSTSAQVALPRSFRLLEDRGDLLARRRREGLGQVALRPIGGPLAAVQPVELEQALEQCHFQHGAAFEAIDRSDLGLA